MKYFQNHNVIFVEASTACLNLVSKASDFVAHNLLISNQHVFIFSEVPLVIYQKEQKESK